MWIFLNNAFLSIVADRDDPGIFRVRARFRGDIERVFPEASVQVDAGTDYKFRALLPRSRVTEAIAVAVTAIKATNFKDSVEEHWRHDVYLKVWNVMYRAQKERAAG